MERSRSAVSRALGCAAAAIVTVGCTSSVDLDRRPAQDDDQALVGGFAAGDPSFDAVGGVAVLLDSPETGERNLVLVCSGVLIEASTVVTAKHCLDAPLEFGEGYRLVYLTGPDASAPSRVMEVLATEGAPHDHGGYTGYGADVGVLHLVGRVENVVPMRIAGVTDSMVGRDFITFGYGAMDRSQAYGQRRVGSVELRANKGPTYQALLGSFEAFYESETRQPLPPNCDPQRSAIGEALQGRVTGCETVEVVRAVYEAYRLEQNNELAVGGTPGDVQACNGDSGGPLVLTGVDGRMTAYGVVSGGLTSRTLECAHGAVYASFSPEVLTFLQNAMRWTDPCAALPSGGLCIGNTAQRCATPLEGARRRLTFDCARVGTTCRQQASGTVGCGTGATDIARPPSRTSGAAPSIDPMTFSRRGFLAPGERLSMSAAQAAPSTESTP